LLLLLRFLNYAKKIVSFVCELQYFMPFDLFGILQETLQLESSSIIFGWISLFFFLLKLNLFCSLDQLPRSSSNFAMLVEPFSSHCGHLCTSRQTFLAKSPGCLHIFHWRLGESYSLSNLSETTIGH
jgi:hypothetical protein